MTGMEALAERLESFPQTRLGLFPTPLHRLNRISDMFGVDVFIKRDDMTGTCLFGGNKIRKLEFLLGAAKQMGCDTVFTYGASQSNHAMETATAARMVGMTPILWLYSLLDETDEYPKGNVLLDRIFGAEIHMVYGENGKERALEQGHAHMEELTRQGQCCMEIPIGGSTNVGCLGYAKGFAEICSQLGEAPDYVYLAAGSGGTLAGVHAGRAFLNAPTQIVGVTVLDLDETYEKSIEELANSTLALLGEKPLVKAESIRLERDYWQPGYECPNEEANQAIRFLARTEGVLTDPVYSGKGFYGLLDNLRRGLIPKGSRVVFLHTGGTTALFAEPEILGELAR